jgi:hypothetical protein
MDQDQDKYGIRSLAQGLEIFRNKIWRKEEKDLVEGNWRKS